MPPDIDQPASPRHAGFMLQGLTIILLCQFTGQALAAALHLPLPGPLVGMLILLAGLAWRGAIPAPIAQAGDGLLRYLGLLYVPAGAGIAAELPLLGHNLLAIGLALAVSALLGLAVTGWLMQLLAGPDAP